MPVRTPLLGRLHGLCSTSRCQAARPAWTLTAGDRAAASVNLDHQSAHAPTTTPELPRAVTERLKSLPADILNVLLDGKNVGESTSAPVSSLKDMAKYYFEKGGKLIRPSVTLLMSEVCNGRAKELGNTSDRETINQNQYRIAMVAEMIHTASLIHDDVIDEAGTRRGIPTANVKWGNKKAVLGGDRILARATKLLCMTRDPDVISTMASIVDNLVDGEFMQLEVHPEADAMSRFQHYMQKSYYKTASLFANSCLSVAILSGCPTSFRSQAYEFGRNFGLAFQLMDDMLDYVANSVDLGKPSVADLRQGLATGPVLFAAQEFPELNSLINRRFAQPGDVEQAYRIVIASNALEQTRQLIRRHCDTAISLAQDLSQCSSGRTLTALAAAQVHRDR